MEIEIKFWSNGGEMTKLMIVISSKLVGSPTVQKLRMTTEGFQILGGFCGYPATIENNQQQPTSNQQPTSTH